MGFDRAAFDRSKNSKRAAYTTRLVRRWKMRKGCERCGYKDHFAALELDHVDPSSKNPYTYSALNPLWGKQRLKQELSKCRVLCSNCHRIRGFLDGHHKRGNI